MKKCSSKLNEMLALFGVIIDLLKINLMIEWK